MLEGNRMVRDNRDAHLDTIAKAFKWTRDDAREELAKVHLSNLPENLAFFSGAIDAAGSFGGIYQSAVLAYGSELIKDPARRRIASPAWPRSRRSRAAASSRIRRSRSRRSAPARPGTLESNPLLSKDIRFLFEPNSATLDLDEPVEPVEPRRDQEDAAGQPGLDHPAARPRRQRAWSRSSASSGGDAFVRTQALKAMELSKQRAAEIRQMLDHAPERRPAAHRGASAAAGKNRLAEPRREPARRGAVVHH